LITRNTGQIMPKVHTPLTLVDERQYAQNEKCAAVPAIEVEQNLQRE
jgi:hypothetical protein